MRMRRTIRKGCAPPSQSSRRGPSPSIAVVNDCNDSLQATFVHNRTRTREKYDSQPPGGQRSRGTQSNQQGAPVGGVATEVGWADEKQSSIPCAPRLGV